MKTSSVALKEKIMIVKKNATSGMEVNINGVFIYLLNKHFVYL